MKTSHSREEIEALANQAEGLAFLKGKWVEINNETLTKVLDALDDVDEHGSMTFADILRLRAGINTSEGSEIELASSVKNIQWLQKVLDQMREPAQSEQIEPSSELNAELRHYQHAGLNWLWSMNSLGFGALLADDMGLGKTLQILALLDKVREAKLLQKESMKALLVVPASLLINWEKEAQKFTPNLKVAIMHGNNTQLDLDSADLFITTYGMVSRIEELAATHWDFMIIDEAQAIKNPITKQTKAVKSIEAGIRIALTGTPIENKLSDLWSIFDFINSGLLGTAKEFKKWASSLSERPEGYAKLSEMVSPFILRRLKTDKKVISDLPDKTEAIQWTTLSKKQVALYSTLVDKLQETLLSNSDELSDMQRRGLVLSSIMKFKQICNHPDQYIGSGAFDEKQSGKFGALEEICETIREKHESVLVFTQFKETCEPLNNFLQKVFGRPGLVIHGGTTPKKRGEFVKQFNSHYVPFMVLSLKAGGVGLNLTAANHVIHFDRWWNPAVENQATDRAFRIGQTKNVMVHKFITSGIIEEKIDEIIQNKTQLATDVIAESTGENWITEMGSQELLSLFELDVK